MQPFNFPKNPKTNAPTTRKQPPVHRYPAPYGVVPQQISTTETNPQRTINEPFNKNASANPFEESHHSTQAQIENNQDSPQSPAQFFQNSENKGNFFLRGKEIIGRS